METLLFSLEKNIARITFNRPQKMNTFNKLMGEELEALTKEVKEDENIRAVILKGDGPSFMAGGDIQFFFQHLSKMPEGVLKIVNSLNASVLNLMQMPKPVLASVHGSVAGAGMSLMMACDLVIAEENTKMTMAYSGIGISPDGGATINLPLNVGVKKAMEWLLLSEIFDAKTAEKGGLINWVVPQELLHQKTEEILLKLSKGPTLALASSKQLINAHYNLKKRLEDEANAFVSCTTTEDFKMGVSSFLKKIPPKFIGK